MITNLINKNIAYYVVIFLTSCNLSVSDLEYSGETILNEQYSRRCGFDIDINYYNKVDISEPYFDNVNLTTKKVKQE